MWVAPTAVQDAGTGPCALWDGRLNSRLEVKSLTTDISVKCQHQTALAKRLLRLMPFDLVVIVTLMFLFIMCLKNKVVSILIERKCD